MRNLSTTHGTVITHFCVARRQGVKFLVEQLLAASNFFHVRAVSSLLVCMYQKSLHPFNKNIIAKNYVWYSYTEKHFKCMFYEIYIIFTSVAGTLFTWS